MSDIWLAPAKLNLFLHITGQRPDGYHNLHTAFQFLDYSDELTFTSRHDGIINLETPLKGVSDEDNLIIRAAKLLHSQANCNQQFGVNIRLKKVLPMGGGLGGGSSNAATSLLALNQLWQLNLASHELKRIGLELGADVPVFIHGEACIAKGIGEEFTPAYPEQNWYLVLVPTCHVNTSEIFSDSALTRDSKTLRIRAPLNWEVLGKLRNDCESVVTKRYPEVKQALSWLSKYGVARMTGTGCCVFCSFPTEQEAKKVQNLLPLDLKGFVARGVNQSPVKRSLS
ncbi:MAG: 4-(cytidine 5'-diphospho)-2-C-methyl-D-erythritol kinase [Gammaproteobacteria bacterium]|nr:MAG: 4-(cytidine 5'-diphospho)-2-C-methyl-D-erythritol kinase [Gammaproteobacteria bacterium]